MDPSDVMWLLTSLLTLWQEIRHRKQKKATTKDLMPAKPVRK